MNGYAPNTSSRDVRLDPEAVALLIRTRKATRGLAIAVFVLTGLALLALMFLEDQLAAQAGDLVTMMYVVTAAWGVLGLFVSLYRRWAVIGVLVLAYLNLAGDVWIFLSTGNLPWTGIALLAGLAYGCHLVLRLNRRLAPHGLAMRMDPATLTKDAP